MSRKLLDELQGMSPAEILARMDDGMPKLHVIHTALALRCQHPEWVRSRVGGASGCRSVPGQERLKPRELMCSKIAAKSTVPLWPAPPNEEESGGRVAHDTRVLRGSFVPSE